MAVFRFSALSGAQSLAINHSYPTVELLNPTQAIDVAGAAGTSKF